MPDGHYASALAMSESGASRTPDTDDNTGKF